VQTRKSVENYEEFFWLTIGGAIYSAAIFGCQATTNRNTKCGLDYRFNPQSGPHFK
jgi:hypothetical protein